MQPIGLIKEIDKLGRLGIPKEVRERMGLNVRVELIMTCEGLLVRKYDGGKKTQSCKDNKKML